jgi:hypothetical protein
MWKWVRELDSILRGEATRLPALREGKINVAVGGLSVLLVLLGAFYGFGMGWYALFNRDAPEFQQTLASTVKVPALFLLTLAVTFPSLYVFNALVGSRLQVGSLFRLLLASLAVTLAVLASFGPIVAFFSVTTSSYHFISVLNVLMFAVAGGLGLAFLLQTLNRLTVAGRPQPAPEAPVPVPADAPPPSASAAPAPPPGALDAAGGHVLGRNVKVVFYVWVVVFALVGAQMSWVLRPFIGDPAQPFTWFRPRQSHFFEAVWNDLRHLVP